MQFGGINWLAVAIAAVAGYGVGMAWYMILGKRWMAANGLTEDILKAGGIRGAIPFILAALANVAISIGFAGLLGHLGIGQTTLRNAIISAVVVWFIFILATIAVNYSFARRPSVLIAIDGGHWLAVMLVMGAILGLMGV
jgi:hypothetical protein